jgi:hypothetical protein
MDTGQLSWLPRGTLLAERIVMAPSSPIRVVFEDSAYGARLGVLECAGARVAVVLQRGVLAAVAPMPGVTRGPGLDAILEFLTSASRVAAST